MKIHVDSSVCLGMIKNKNNVKWAIYVSSGLGPGNVIGNVI
jgi:hypothetical protein